ncbi:uncharacterized protein N7459_003280 [Penicillium hispanicum]|uniref:uncharacterized protein n=1 Tax=Penicillium hispanicum TaxID=1080232 RepID=UPI00254064C9|nr:uncharacterized protein N7459_003280 [Penicillium hispanicum]KAJ5587515.1 hypothetical protein N7459_003280 [Penicillium hispanicum]
MSAHGAALFCTFPWSVGLPLCLTVPPFLTPFNSNPDMSDEPGVQFMGARSKYSLRIQRTHREMSQESGEGSQRSWHRHFHPPRPERVDSRPALLPPLRPPREGYDFRHPVESTAPEGDVIDLTNEPETPPQRGQPRDSESRTSNTSRLPRFGRDIMANVVDLEEDESGDPAEGPSSSPEVQFVRATVRQPQRDRWNPIPLLSDNSIVRQASNRVQQWGLAPNNSRGYRLPSLQFFNLRPQSNLGQMETLYIGSDDSGANANFADVSLDYGLSSFSMDSSNRPENRRRDTYKAPSPAPQGFTRTLAEDDVAICPNCNRELGIGEGKKQEIWVAKQCGHVYCGDCAENRSKSKAKKTNGPQRTKPFSKCQVADCGKPVSAPTSMFHLYL